MRSLHEADDTLKSFDGELLSEEKKLVTNTWLNELADLAESGDIQSLKTKIYQKKADLNRQIDI